MALRDRGFHPYDGPRTPAATRFLVLARYGLGDAVSSKRTLAFLILGAVWPLIAAVMIYLHHNAAALAMLGLPLEELLPIDAGFFLRALKVQAFVAFFVILSSGATLVSRDLRDNGLALVLSRPLSRAEYVLGKLTVLLLLGSAVTWVPLLLLFALQTSLAGRAWLVENLVVGLGAFLGAWLVLLVLGLTCLALSSVLRAKAAAEGAFAALFPVLAFVGAAIDRFLRVEWGVLLNVPALLDALWRPLFGLAPRPDLAAAAAATALAALVGLCLWILHRRTRAYEVVR